MVPHCNHEPFVAPSQSVKFPVEKIDATSRFVVIKISACADNLELSFWVESVTIRLSTVIPREVNNGVMTSETPFARVVSSPS